MVVYTSFLGMLRYEAVSKLSSSEVAYHTKLYDGCSGIFSKT